MTADFRYDEFVHRNIGFVSEAEQQRLRQSSVLICGVGGMGGACLQSLARVGVGGLAVADFDVFEISNLNRQVFANLDTVGRGKVAATVDQLRRINPELNIEVLDETWVDRLDDLLQRYRVVVNGTDDIRAGIQLYRKAREHGATVVDAYTSPLPSVTVVAPSSPRPEERLGYPSLRQHWRELSQADCDVCFQRELEYVLINSSSVKYVDLKVATELIAGRRKRMSFAPMVITTGNLMAFEVIKLLLSKPTSADHRGYFLDPWQMRIERPRSAPVALVMRSLVRRFMRKLLNG